MTPSPSFASDSDRSAPASGRNGTFRSAAAVSLIALVVLAGGLAAHVHHAYDGDVSGTYHVDAASHDAFAFERWYPQGELYITHGPYDGHYFLAFANDPLLDEVLDTEKGARARFYRGRRILWSWTGWTLGAGNPDAILWTLPLASLLSTAAAVFALAWLLRAHGRHAALALLYAAGIGVAVSLVRSTADLFATNLAVIGACAWSCARVRSAAILFAAAALAKETTILLPFCLALASITNAVRDRGASRVAGLVEKMRHLGWRGGWREPVWLLLVPATMFAWWGYLMATGPSGSVRNGNIGLPFAGIVSYLADRRGAPLAEWTSFVATLAAVVVGLAGSRALLRRIDGFRLAVLAFAGLAIVTNHTVWIEMWAYGRIHMILPALLLVTFAREGKTLDAVAAALTAVAGLAAWAAFV